MAGGVTARTPAPEANEPALPAGLAFSPHTSEYLVEPVRTGDI
jgi:hypothetical protein